MKKTILLAFCALACFGSVCAQADKKENATKLKAIKEHREAVHLKGGWIRDPYIVLAPDGFYYLTGTTPGPGDPREQSDPYNTGLGNTSLVGHVLQIWRSQDLVDWEYLGAPYDTKNTPKFANGAGDNVNWNQQRLWAPELHWAGDKWVLVHCPGGVSELALSDGPGFDKWTFPNSTVFNKRHDPSFFIDRDGTSYILWTEGLKDFFICPVKKDFSGFAGPVKQITSGDRRIGHEGATMLRIGEKYVFFGTAWSTDTGRKGSYNLYYCTSDSPYGPYTDRRFVGRFLGHGTPFQDKSGNWWCTAFFNGNVPPVDATGIENRDLRADAQTINQTGTTIVPLEVRVLPDGDVYVAAKDKRYYNIGPDEVDKVKLEKSRSEIEAKLKK